MTAAAIAAEAGVDDFLAEATPEAKLKLIREYQAQGHLVAMTGDGTNDAPAVSYTHLDVYKRQAGSRSNLGASMRRSKFDQFQIEFYPDKSDNEGNNPRTQMHFILDCCYGFMRHFGEEGNKNLLFYGSTGLGKTCLTAAISNELIEKGYTVMYYSARELFSMLTDNEFQQNLSILDVMMFNSVSEIREMLKKYTLKTSVI